ncbi:phosphoglycerate dehydrogenase [Solirubrobacter phytolaccae]|uniref:Phosphoglycerate dehydrogenase n=1 Tax=Solirubrobacter phytolaccae TaxID=1404360 RepID=A0A9X3NCW2_9ACTN|nr:phosphoglycerate dehydrogenase [Solirubrobacter phytolaccae]MDA0184345.1 phosphoglycerate dehydrogenase [Solirubrobacter phytolaccae]
MATILITWPDFDAEGADVGRRLTEAGHRLRIAPRTADRTPRDLLALLEGVEAAIVSTDPFDAGVLDAAARLRVIARVGVGTDSIDLQAAARNGVAVCTTPGANTSSSADHTVALMLAALRRVPAHDRAIRAGRWERTGPAVGSELGGATVGLVGYGAIGRAVHERLTGFGARILICDPFAPAGGPGVRHVDLDTLLRASDVVSLHLPLTPGTRHLLDRARLALLPAHAILVNTARGGLVDEDALADALEAGALRAAALDVLALEPSPPGRLHALENVTLTPHVAGLSEPSIREMTRRAVDAALAVLDGRRPEGLVSISEPNEVTPA